MCVCVWRGVWHEAMVCGGGGGYKKKLYQYGSVGLGVCGEGEGGGLF